MIRSGKQWVLKHESTPTLFCEDISQKGWFSHEAQATSLRCRDPWYYHPPLCFGNLWVTLLLVCCSKWSWSVRFGTGHFLRVLLGFGGLAMVSPSH